MKHTALELWHDCVKQRSAARLDQLLADDVIFHSPVVHTPQVGKVLTKAYLTAALRALGNESFRYTKEIVQGATAVLEFETVVEGITINGVDIITWNPDEQIVEFKVMIRPLKAVNLIHQFMGALLAKQ